ncbi:MAG: flavin reductase family protein [Bacteroidetes bacterium]|nr:flavin reductase family protein [Bacteroidota bacterium]
MQSIPINDFLVRINDLWKNKWFLLTSGDYNSKHFNTMTIAWGYFGIMWNKPFAAVVVRPTRFTFEFMNKYDTFSLCSFDKTYSEDLSLLGSKSGRDGNKIAETKLTVIPPQKITAPSFNEAELAIECKKIYWDDYKPENFLDDSINKVYPLKDYHRIYYGEILGIWGDAKYAHK